MDGVNACIANDLLTPVTQTLEA